MISRWSVAAAVFGAACNLACSALLDYQHYFLLHERFIWSYSSIIVEGISLAPLPALYVFRRYALLVFPYALALFSILMERVHLLMQYHRLGPLALASKYDSPGVLQILLGGISIAIVLLWATIRVVVAIWHGQKRSGQPLAKH
jgi:hypothetical protein